MGPFDFQIRTRVLFGEGRFEELGALARELGFRRTLVVADRGLVAAGYVARAVERLAKAGVEAFAFHDFEPNPDTVMVEAGRVFAAACRVDSIIGLGGGSSLDCAKGINFVHTNGGSMRDYWGYGKATRPMLPMIAVPTTAGTGSEAQCYALISDAGTHVKMSCGDPNAASQCFAREAWRLLAANYERVLCNPDDLEARGAMQLGAHLAGIAIEHSMLGAAHACANPLTSHYGITHGLAIAALLPHVVRWNHLAVGELYRELDEGDLGDRLARMAEVADLSVRLREHGVSREALPSLAEEAAAQWTGQFNPRPFDAAGAVEIYEWSF